MGFISYSGSLFLSSRFIEIRGQTSRQKLRNQPQALGLRTLTLVRVSLISLGWTDPRDSRRMYEYLCCSVPFKCMDVDDQLFTIGCCLLIYSLYGVPFHAIYGLHSFFLSLVVYQTTTIEEKMDHSRNHIIINYNFRK